MNSSIAPPESKSNKEVQCHPLILNPRNPDEADKIIRIRAREEIEISDTILCQIRDLISTRCPAEKHSSEQLNDLVKAHVGSLGIADYGVWVYYPWSRRLVHLLGKEEFIELRTNRNKYKITDDEQKNLGRMKIGLVGLSVGFAVTLALTLERSYGEIRLADFDTLDLSNLNRIPLGVHALGIPKVVLAARAIAEIDPFLEIKIFQEGLRSDNSAAFFDEGGPLNLVIDECDSLDIKVQLRYEARKRGIPVLMETSDRGLIDIERFDLEPNRPIFHGLVGDPEVTSLRGLSSEEKIPFLMKIVGVETASSRVKASAIEIEQTLKTWPQLGSQVIHGGGAVGDTARRILLDQFQNSGRFHIDFEDLIGGNCSPNDKVKFPIDPNNSKNKLSKEDWIHKAKAAKNRLYKKIAAPKSIHFNDNALFRRLIEAAISAPSGGNVQPWKWVQLGNEIYLFLDPERTGSFLDFKGEASLIALGAATENLLLMARSLGLEISFQSFPDPEDSGLIAIFFIESLTTQKVGDPESLAPFIAHRCTDRQLWSSEPLAPEILEKIVHSIRDVPGSQVQLIDSEKDKQTLGELAGRADRFRMFNSEAHEDFVREIRWTDAEADQSRDGLSIQGLALRPVDEAGLRICRDPKSVSWLRKWNLGKNLEKLSFKSIKHSSAVGLITMPEIRDPDFFLGGRAVEKVWLTATSLGLVFQPMTALLYLFSRLERGRPNGFDLQEIEELLALRAQYTNIFGALRGRAEIMLFRLGRGESPGMKSHRRPPDDVFFSDNGEIKSP